MEQPNNDMTTLSQVLEKLKAKGIETEIRMNNENQMVVSGSNKKYEPEDLLIIKNFRFEGMSDPADNVVLYVIEDKDGNKGYILDSYGAFSNQEGTYFDDFIKSVPTEDRDEQELFS